MNISSNKKIVSYTASIAGGIAFLLLFWWIGTDPTKDFVLHTPGMDNRPDASALGIPTENINIGEFFQVFDGTPSNIPGSWPRFRGPSFDNINGEKISLSDNWETNPPRVLWSIELGEGHAAPAIFDGRFYILDYDEEEKCDALRCFSLEDGREIWRRSYKVRVKRNHGLSRTIPAVTDSFVVSIGPRCHVMCVKSKSGDFLWGIDLEKEYAVETPFWYTGQCALIDNDVAVIAAGGTALMFGVDCKTGSIIWQTPNPKNWQMSHSSVMPMVFNGKKMYIYCAIGGVVGIAAEGEDAGKILWEIDEWAPSVVAPSPVILEDGRVFVSAGYGAGSMLFKLNESGGVYTAEILQQYKPAKGISSEQQTPIFYKGHLFSVQPKDALGLRLQLVCYNPDDCTKPVWSSGKTNRFGLGPYLIADKKMFVLNDDGLLTLLQASVSGYKQLGQIQVMDGIDAWGPMALVDGRLLLRDHHRLYCLDVRKKSAL